jgi:hypothetical protein
VVPEIVAIDEGRGAKATLRLLAGLAVAFTLLVQPKRIRGVGVEGNLRIL